MTNSNENKVEGKIDELKGKAKEAYGNITDDKGKQASGKVDKLKGKAKEKLGEFQEKMNDEDKQ